MASIIEDIEIVEAILGEVAAFAGGQPAVVTKVIGGNNYTLSVVKLANGPVAPYQTISGSFWEILITALADAAAIAAGAPLAIAEKIGNTWYGTTLTEVPKAASA